MPGSVLACKPAHLTEVFSGFLSHWKSIIQYQSMTVSFPIQHHNKPQIQRYRPCSRSVPLLYLGAARNHFDRKTQQKISVVKKFLNDYHLSEMMAHTSQL
jgi:hypothetical protein